MKFHRCEELHINQGGGRVSGLEMEVYTCNNVYEDCFVRKLNSFDHRAYKCEASATRLTHVIVLDQFLLHMKFHMRLDKICCAAKTFVGHFRLFHFRILKKSKCNHDVAKFDAA